MDKDPIKTYFPPRLMEQLVDKARDAISEEFTRKEAAAHKKNESNDADEYIYVASSLVRTIAKEHGDLSHFVPPLVAKALEDKL